ncbi:Protein-tyrosine phosphatase, dual specificity domain protein [Candidatus Desulfofervidus auxilii]|uniref:Protein-tyrosine phosphatase, dual specificity domain protein n=1 Tax=Desulfofervidus auxilii TaxID=1621989 RepID=A0A7U4QK88_DESA2|nr:dual specificity protein phosphatase [Candidatus Desulfofervidus auxilii]AMM40898.1 Protein-tyrosine phosphatase, dual specificity domain protein [Candidatus Desulfofervidus auxilii]
MKFILDHLAIGSYEEALRPSSEITALLNVAKEKDLKTSLLYHKVPIIDMQPIPSAQMLEAAKWIQKHISKHIIMVFCNAGIGRSPSVVIGYLCCFLNYGFGEAIEYVAKRKSDISILPNLLRTIEEVKAEI